MWDFSDKHRDKKRRLSRHEEKLCWDKNPHVCNICGEKIHGISDCQFDHSESWSEGGKTNLKNVKLVHGACNNYKGKKPLEEVRESLGYYEKTKEKRPFDDNKYNALFGSDGDGKKKKKSGAFGTFDYDWGL